MQFFNSIDKLCSKFSSLIRQSCQYLGMKTTFETGCDLRVVSKVWTPNQTHALQTWYFHQTPFSSTSRADPSTRSFEILVQLQLGLVWHRVRNTCNSFDKSNISFQHNSILGQIPDGFRLSKGEKYM